MLSLRAMLHLELPHVNVLSKIDLIQQYGDLGECTPPSRFLSIKFTHFISIRPRA